MNASTIRILRTARGLSQDDLARIAHVGRRSIVRLERGDGHLAHDATRARIAQALGVPVDVLFTDDGHAIAPTPEGAPHD
jgi:transcriptional regulator with XRE-family HTH domain